jgi:hypothetical protein
MYSFNEEQPHENSNHGDVKNLRRQEVYWKKKEAE